MSSSGLTLPPPFSLVSLREAGDAFAHASTIAGEAGAATLVWTRRFDLAEFAVVLEPQEPLATARRAIYAGANALADTVAAHAPPQRAVSFDWPDALRVDGALVGGVRLGWPDHAAEHEVPDWLVFGAMLRTVVMRAGEPGLRPLLGGLDEQGFEELSPASVVEGWTRYFLREMHAFEDRGFGAVRDRWLERAPGIPALLDTGDATGPDGQRPLAPALAEPSWLDPATGGPWL